MINRTAALNMTIPFLDLSRPWLRLWCAFLCLILPLILGIGLLQKDYEKQIGGILTVGQTGEYRVLKKKQQEDMKNRMKEEIEAIKREQSRM